MKNLILFSLLLIFLNISCRNKKDLTNPAEKSQNYFPIKENQILSYAVSKRNYSTLNAIDSNYIHAVQITSINQNSDKETDFFVETNSPYFDLVNHGLWKDNNKLILSEDNQYYVKLYFPLMNDKTWNGNLYNTLPPQLYSVSGLGSSWEEYPNTVTIIQKNDSNLLYRDFQIEIYALNVGLVYKEIKKVSFSDSPEDFGKGIIVDGYVRKERLVKYEKK